MNIAILGYGVEGESVYNYYRKKYPEAHFTAYDNNLQPKNPVPDGVEFFGGVKDFKGIDADIAIKTPAIAPWNVEVSGEVTTMTREFLKVCPAPVIGVTGTKGKGTTASLIKSILDASGKKAWLVGNIGVGAFDVLDQISPEDIVVYELSSFQLWDIDVSPHVAVVLGIEPEHLDVHKDFDDYLMAKANIAKYQQPDDIIVYKSDNQYAASIATMSQAERVPYQDTTTAHVSDGKFFYGEQELCPTKVLKLPGSHNQDNACAAINAAWNLVKDREAISQGLSAFEGLPHRLKYVRTVDEVDYYDDSVGTTPGSAIAALNSFDEPKIIILGGYDKGASFENLAHVINAKSGSIRRVILIGYEAPKIEASLQAVGYTNYDNLGMSITMEEIVKTASQHARAGDVVILSPACASFDMFKNIYDRGEQFIRAVQSLA